MQRLSKQLATIGCIGYLKAPGTMGSLAALPLVYFFSTMQIFQLTVSMIIMLVCSLIIVHKALPAFQESDPSQIIIDEVVGCCVTFYGVSLNLYTIIVGFLLFRFFDIFKPLGIKKIEKLPGAFGVIADDFVAGIFANLLLRWLFS